jgi:hypothetical protein
MSLFKCGICGDIFISGPETSTIESNEFIRIHTKHCKPVLNQTDKKEVIKN